MTNLVQLFSKFWSTIGRQFLPVFLIAAVLPIMLFVALSPESITFSSKAAKATEIRVWFEPSSIIANPNQQIELSVMAAFDAESGLLPSLKTQLTSDPGLVLSSSEIVSNRPFKGRTVLEKITVSAKKMGTYTIEIPKESVTTSLSGQVLVETSGATITIR